MIEGRLYLAYGVLHYSVLHLSVLFCWDAKLEDPAMYKFQMLQSLEGQPFLYDQP